MRLKELRGLPVVDPTAARKIGTVADYQVDPASGRLAALDITPAAGGDGERVLAQRVRRVGRSAVVLTARGGAMSSTPTELNERWLDTSTLVGLEVMGDDGTRIGHLVDALFDQDSLAVEAYLLQGGGLLDSLSGRRNRIEPDKVHSCSRELMMISGGATEVVEPAETPPAEETAAAKESTPADETAPLETPVTLKDADRLPTPSVEAVRDGQPASTPSG
ncbi:MAG: PRC-barrel domain-containing protein [Chloroflexi bacterium]|nr:PRC-barrel domain-containing protein [Chloroflexota bacterium]MBV9599154.1 PRC-barrel domain-containing protein [Chloroflexota bacterium]